MTRKKVKIGDLVVIDFQDHHSYRGLDREDLSEFEPMKCQVFGQIIEITDSEVRLARSQYKGNINIDQIDIYSVVIGAITSVHRANITEEVVIS